MSLLIFPLSEFGLNFGDAVRVYAGNSTSEDALVMLFTGRGRGRVDVPEPFATVHFSSDMTNPAVPASESLIGDW